MGAIFRSEGSKFFSNNWCLLGSVLTLLLAPMFILVSGQMSFQNDLSQGLRFMYMSQIGLVICAGAFCGQEFLDDCLQVTLLCIPKRGRMLAAKFVFLGLLTLILGLFSSSFCVIVSLCRGNGGLTADVVFGFYKDVLFGLFSWFQLTWITGGLTFLTKSFAFPLAVLFSLILGGSQLLLAVTSVAKYLPDLAGISLFVSDQGSPFLNALTGLAVQFLWLLLCAGLGCWRVTHFDAR